VSFTFLVALRSFCILAVVVIFSVLEAAEPAQAKTNRVRAEQRLAIEKGRAAAAGKVRWVVVFVFVDVVGVPRQQKRRAAPASLEVKLLPADQRESVASSPAQLAC